MSTYKLVADVSKWNPDNLVFFKQLKSRGVTAVIVKLTEGSTYRNAKAQKQIKNAWQAGLHVHGYHYARYTTSAKAKEEAIFFCKTAKALGLYATSVLAVDVEDNSLPQNGLTALTNTFLVQTKANGYTKTDYYTMASWIWNKRLIPSTLSAKNQWIARYNAKLPGVDNVGTWQFTDNWQNLGVDMSYDFNVGAP